MRKKGGHMPLRRTCLALVFCLALVAASGNARAASLHLLSISISTIGGTTRCVLKTDGPAEFSSHRLSNPARIYMDLKGFTFQKGVLAGLRSAGLIEEVRVGQFDARTVRIVFVFKKLPDLIVSRLSGGNGFVLDFSNGEVLPSGTNEKRDNRDAKELAAIRAEALNYASVNRLPSGGASVQGHNAAISNGPGDSGISGPRTAGESASVSVPGAHDQGKIDWNEIHGNSSPSSHEWRVVIDAGHGGKDPGTSGEDGCHEKQYTLEIAQKLAGILRGKGYKVFLTRDADYFVTLDKRTLMANRDRADIFVSVHINWSSDPDTRGITTYFLNWTNDAEAEKVAARENQISMKRMKAARTQLGAILASLELEGKRNESLKLANYVEDSTMRLVRAAHPGETDWGVKRAIFYVLIGDRMPSILTEVSFLSNSRDEALLQDPSYIDAVAEGMAHGIEDYFRHQAPALPARTYASR